MGRAFVRCATEILTTAEMVITANGQKNKRDWSKNSNGMKRNNKGGIKLEKLERVIKFGEPIDTRETRIKAMLENANKLYEPATFTAFVLGCIEGAATMPGQDIGQRLAEVQTILRAWREIKEGVSSAS